MFKNVLSEIQGCANNIFFVHCFNFYEINLLENIQQKKKREIKFLMASFFHPYLNLICYPKFSTHNTWFLFWKIDVKMNVTLKGCLIFVLKRI